MDITTIILVTLSTIFHASWNLSLKEESKDYNFINSFNIASAIIVLPIAIWALFKTEGLIQVLPYLVGSSLCNVLYFFFLTKAYMSGDFSIAYTVSRSSPIFVVTIAGLFLGEIPSTTGLCGILLVVLGCFFLPFGKIKEIPKEFNFKAYLNMTMVFAFLTALATSGYSILDKVGSGILCRSGGKMGPLVFMSFEWIITGIFSIIVMIILNKKNIYKPLFKQTKKVFFAAFLMTFSYALIMFAYQYAQTGYIVGFRQLSIILGVILGAVVLKEKLYSSRITGIAIITAGLLLLIFA